MEATKTEEKAFATPETKLHFLDYWRIIRIRKTVILAVFLLVSLTTTVVTFMLPESYSSTVQIKIEKDAPDVEIGLGRDRGSANYGGVGYDPYFMETEFKVIQARPVLNNVVETLELQKKWAEKFKMPALPLETAYGILKKQINVRQSRGTSLIEIEAFSDNKDEAAAIANEVAKAYRERRQKIRNDIAASGITVLRSSLTNRWNEIVEQQQLVNMWRTNLNIADYEAYANLPTPTLDQEQLRKLDSQVMEAEIRYAQIEIVYTNLLALQASGDHAALQRSMPHMVPDNTLNTLIDAENTAEQSLARMTNALGKENTDLKSLIDVLKTVRKQIDDRLAGIVDGVKTRLDSDKGLAERYRAIMKVAREKDKENFIERRPYYEAKDRLAQMKEVHMRLSYNVEAQEMELAMPRSAVVQIVEQAVPNDRPVLPRKNLNIAAGVIFGLIIGIGLAFFIEYLDTSVKTIDDVERALQAPVLGVIPQNVGVLIDEGPESPHAEAYRVLRTNVLFSRKDPKLNTLTIVSGGAGEGKSTTIFNLATVFAQNGQRVLIVDSDLRRPSLHKYLKVSNTIGLTNFLMKQNTLEEVVQTTSVPTLDFLPSGKLPSSSMGILSSVQMKELIREVKRRYDFVFFDSPPIMGVSDASILASEVDMVLQVIQYRRYPQPMTIRAKQMIEKVGGNLLGIVLNNINMSQDENYYYYSGYYYDYYSKGEYKGEYTSGEYGRRKRSGEYKAGEYNSRESKPEEKKADKETKVEIKSKF